MKIAKPIAAFLEAVNKHNSDALLSVISNTAIVHDEGKDYHGITEIKQWSDEKVFAANVTLEPISTRKQNGKTIVTAKVYGSFDKTGLPDPLLLDFHFSNNANQVTALSIHFPNPATVVPPLHLLQP
jgi:hypothetical protein